MSVQQLSAILYLFPSSTKEFLEDDVVQTTSEQSRQAQTSRPPRPRTSNDVNLHARNLTDLADFIVAHQNLTVLQKKVLQVEEDSLNYFVGEQHHDQQGGIGIGPHHHAGVLYILSESHLTLHFYNEVRPRPATSSPTSTSTSGESTSSRTTSRVSSALGRTRIILELTTCQDFATLDAKTSVFLQPSTFIADLEKATAKIFDLQDVFVRWGVQLWGTVGVEQDEFAKMNLEVGHEQQGDHAPASAGSKVVTTAPPPMGIALQLSLNLAEVSAGAALPGGERAVFESQTTSSNTTYLFGAGFGKSGSSSSSSSQWDGLQTQLQDTLGGFKYLVGKAGCIEHAEQETTEVTSSFTAPTSCSLEVWSFSDAAALAAQLDAAAGEDEESREQEQERTRGDDLKTPSTGVEDEDPLAASYFPEDESDDLPQHSYLSHRVFFRFNTRIHVLNAIPAMKLANLALRSIINVVEEDHEDGGEQEQGPEIVEELDQGKPKLVVPSTEGSSAGRRHAHDVNALQTSTSASSKNSPDEANKKIDIVILGGGLGTGLQAVLGFKEQDEDGRVAKKSRASGSSSSSSSRIGKITIVDSSSDVRVLAAQLYGEEVVHLQAGNHNDSSGTSTGVLHSQLIPTSFFHEAEFVAYGAGRDLFQWLHTAPRSRRMNWSRAVEEEVDSRSGREEEHRQLQQHAIAVGRSSSHARTEQDLGSRKYYTTFLLCEYCHVFLQQRVEKELRTFSRPYGQAGTTQRPPWSSDVVEGVLDQIAGDLAGYHEHIVGSPTSSEDVETESNHHDDNYSHGSASSKKRSNIVFAAQMGFNPGGLSSYATGHVTPGESTRRMELFGYDEDHEESNKAGRVNSDNSPLQFFEDAAAEEGEEDMGKPHPPLVESRAGSVDQEPMRQQKEQVLEEDIKTKTRRQGSKFFLSQKNHDDPSEFQDLFFLSLRRHFRFVHVWQDNFREFYVIATNMEGFQLAV
ncbi:unnamed protein product [Amoebophrya sp. A120]|nr:unnamed protein product [Amoebophrya sp. A120]|eukprot:GSA120T00019359001.1